MKVDYYLRKEKYLKLSITQEVKYKSIRRIIFINIYVF